MTVTTTLLFGQRWSSANSVDPDQMSHYALCVQGLHYFTLTQQCLDKSVGSIMALLKKK